MILPREINQQNPTHKTKNRVANLAYIVIALLMTIWRSQHTESHHEKRLPQSNFFGKDLLQSPPSDGKSGGFNSNLPYSNKNHRN